MGNCSEEIFANQVAPSSGGWLTALERGIIIGQFENISNDLFANTSGGYADYIIARFLKEYQGPLEVRKSSKQAFFSICLFHLLD